MSILGFLGINLVNAYTIIAYQSNRFSAPIQASLQDVNGTMEFVRTDFECQRFEEFIDNCVACFWGFEGGVRGDLVFQLCSGQYTFENITQVCAYFEIRLFETQFTRRGNGPAYICADSLPDGAQDSDENAYRPVLSELFDSAQFLFLEVPIVAIFAIQSFFELYVDFYGDFYARVEIGWLELFSDVSWLLLIQAVRLFGVECQNTSPSGVTSGSDNSQSIQIAFSAFLIIQLFLDPAIPMVETLFAIRRPNSKLGFPRERIVEPFRKSKRWLRIAQMSHTILIPIWLIGRLYSSLMYFFISTPVSLLLTLPLRFCLEKETFQRVLKRSRLYGIIFFPTVIIFIGFRNAFFLDSCRTFENEPNTGTYLAEFVLPVAFILLNPMLKAFMFCEKPPDSESKVGTCEDGILVAEVVKIDPKNDFTEG